MGVVNIPITVQHGTVQTPAKGTANRINQQIIWTISNPPGSGITFANPPVVFPSPPPSGYAPWVGSTPVAGPGANQWQANVNQVLAPGSTPLTYKYDIVWTTGRLDPDIGNEPYPSLPEDEKPPKDKHHKPEKDR
jgi:hypothetical protein